MVHRTHLAKLPRFSNSVRAASIARHVRDREAFTLGKGLLALPPTKAVDALTFSEFEGSSVDDDDSSRASRRRP